MAVGSLIGCLNAQRLVELAFRVRGNSDFIVFQGQSQTRRQVFAGIRALAAGLQSLGVDRGDRVVSLLPACPEAIHALFVPYLLGNIHVPLHPLLGRHDLHHILADCKARVVICTEGQFGLDHPAILAGLKSDLPDLRHVIVCQTSHGDGNTFLPMSDVVAGDKPLRRTHLRRNDSAVISYTSGTTGRPRGAVHTQGQLWGIAVGANRSQLAPGLLRCLLLPLPPYHAAGMLGIYSALLAGGKVILMDRFDPRQMLEHIEKHKVSRIGASPTMYRWLLQTPGQERYDLSSVQRATFSTEPMSLDVAQALHERLDGTLENIYGASECRLISWTGPGDTWKQAATTVGKPVPGVRVHIVDDARRPAPVGEPGEIAAQTTQMMTGYYGDPILTAQVCDSEGWFYTGDVGYVDEAGYLRLVDRKKDVIIRGGENIYPAEIEHYLETHRLIRRAAVIGVPSKMGSEAAWAYVELWPGAKLSATDVLSFCRGALAPFKIPAEVRFVAHLPTTAIGKVQKYRLRELAAGESVSCPIITH